jgi:transposase
VPWTSSGYLVKKSKRDDKADPVERAAFAKKQMKMPVERLIFIDEFAINTAMTRSHARAPRGERAEVSEPGYHEPNTSVIGALSLTGINALMTIEGAVDTQVFDLFVEHFLVPKLIKGDLVVLDNVKFHYSQRAIELIEAAGASVEHLPAYSPDFNPIEERISKIKSTLRSLKARTKRKLDNALAKAIKMISVDDICGWFAHCGYVFSFI